MILPTKHVSLGQSYLGSGAEILSQIQRPITLTRLWDRARPDLNGISYERFVLTLDLLFSLGAIEFVDGYLKKKNP
jgi:hypothetical protein